VLPGGLAKKYRGMLLSRDPEVVVNGARAFVEIEGIVGPNPGALPAEESRRPAWIAEFADLGVAADRAIELAEAKIEEEGEEEEVDETESVERTPAGDPIVDNDQADSPFVSGEDGAEDDPASAAGLKESKSNSLGGIQEDGSAVVVDPETGESRTVDRRTVERVQSLADLHRSVAVLRREILGLFDQAEAGQITQEEATGRALARIREILPTTNALGSPINEGASMRRILERLATDLFDAEDRTEAEALFFDSLFADPEAFAEVAELFLGLVPGIGEVISARDAYEGFLAAVAASEEGRTGDALIAGGLAGVSAAGAIPILGKVVKLGEGAAKVAVAAGQVVRNRVGLKLSGIPDGTGLRPAAKDGTISGASRNEAWSVEKTTPGIGDGAGDVHRVIKPGKTVYASEETSLFMVPKEPLAAEVLQTGRPLGLTEDKIFADFKSILREEKKKLPADTQFGIRGSAVTGNGFHKDRETYTKDFFDVGRRSDHDVAVISRELLERARRRGIPLRTGKGRTVLLTDKDVRVLGLLPLLKRIHKLTGREDTELMIYGSFEVLDKRGANIKFALK